MALSCRALVCHPVPAVLFVIVATASLLVGFSPTNSLVWQREALNHGECWRLLSAHLVHLSSWHLMMNLLGLWLLATLICDTLSTAQWLALSLISALGVSGLLWLLQPQLQWYAGLSGLLHGLWAGGAAYRWVIERHHLFLLALLALFARLLIGGQVGHGFAVIAEAHWYGAFSGLLWLALTRIYERFRVFD